MNNSSTNAVNTRMLFGQLAQAARAVGNAFAWPLRTSDYLELVNPLWTRHGLLARVESVQDETPDARTLTLRPGRGFRRQRAGQYIHVGVAIDGTQHTRAYSISSAPERDDDAITISVKAVPGGRVSQHLVRTTKPGDCLTITLAQGDFVLPDSAPIKPLFISAGSGITPIMSMLRSLVARDRLPDVVHLHYVRDARDTIFGDELRELTRKQPLYKLSLMATRTAAEAEPCSAGPERHFHGQQLEQLCPDWRTRDVYVCGPEALLSAVERHYRAAGLGSRVQSERFRAASAPAPRNVSAGKVRFSKSAKDARSDGVTNLLRLAEETGLNPAHGCRMGICHGCVAVLKSGCVRDLRTNALINEPGQSVQICVCAAAGDAEIEI